MVLVELHHGVAMTFGQLAVGEVKVQVFSSSAAELALKSLHDLLERLNLHLQPDYFLNAEV